MDVLVPSDREQPSAAVDPHPAVGMGVSCIL